MFSSEDLVGAVLGTFFATILVAGLLVLAVYCFFLKPKLARGGIQSRQNGHAVGLEDQLHVTVDQGCQDQEMIPYDLKQRETPPDEDRSNFANTCQRRLDHVSISQNHPDRVKNFQDHVDYVPKSNGHLDRVTISQVHEAIDLHITKSDVSYQVKADDSIVKRNHKLNTENENNVYFLDAIDFKGADNRLSGDAKCVQIQAPNQSVVSFDLQNFDESKRFDYLNQNAYDNNHHDNRTQCSPASQLNPVLHSKTQPEIGALIRGDEGSVRDNCIGSVADSWRSDNTNRQIAETSLNSSHSNLPSTDKEPRSHVERTADETVGRSGGDEFGDTLEHSRNIKIVADDDADANNFGLCGKWTEPTIDDVSRSCESRGGVAYYVSVE